MSQAVLEFAAVSHSTKFWHDRHVPPFPGAVLLFFLFYNFFTEYCYTPAFMRNKTKAREGILKLRPMMYVLDARI